MTAEAPPREALLKAGTNEPAWLAASLVPPGRPVALREGAPVGIEDALRARGCTVDPAATLHLGHPDAIGGAADVAVLVAPHAGHGAHAGAPPPEARSLSQLEGAAAGFGGALAAVRQVAPFDTTAAPHLAADPDAFVRWLGVLAGGPDAAPPPTCPARPPKRSVLALAVEPFNQWDEERRRLLLDLRERLDERGIALVLHWSQVRLSGSPQAHLDLARAGMHLHGTDGVAAEAEPTGWASNATAAHRLTSAYGPEVVVLLDPERHDPTVVVAASFRPDTTFLGLGFEGEALDDWAPPGRLVQEVLAAIDRDRRAGPTRVAAVPRTDRVAGMTSIVIPVHGRWGLTRACLDRIARHTPEPHEVVVVDNASPDETPHRLADREDVRVVTAAENLGFAGGTNLGIQHARGAFVCLLNNDTEVTPGWLRELQAALAVPGTGAVGPRTNNISGLQSARDAPTLANPDAHAWAAEMAAGRRGRSWPINRLVGFCLLVRGVDLERLGALDEGVGLGNYEDDELCLRLRRDGQRLRVADGAWVLHHGSATFHGTGISPLETARSGSRHLGGRPQLPPDLAIARVRAGGDPDLLARVAGNARGIADEVHLAVADDPALPWLLAVADHDPMGSSWSVGEVPVETPARWAVHLGPEDLLSPEDWGRDRSALEALPRRVHRVAGMPGVVLEPLEGTVGPPPSTDDATPVTDVIRPVDLAGR